MLPRPLVVASSLSVLSIVLASATATTMSTPRAPLALPPSGRELVLWLYAPSATNDTWASWYGEISEHRANVTGISPCVYLMNNSGVLVSQVPDLAVAQNWTQFFVTTLSLTATPLIAASGVGMNIAINNSEIGDAWIQATLDEALRFNYSGYSLQLEEPGSPEIAELWLAYLTRWLDAFAPYNLTIGVITGSVCRGKDWMDVDCGNYRAIAENATHPRPNLQAIPEATYEGEPTLWKEYAQDLAKGLGSTATFGMSYVPALLNPENGCLPLAISLNVTRLYVWVDPPDNSTQQAWEAFGWWLTAPSSGEERE